MHNGAQREVLVVEDSKVQAEILRRLLESQGYTVRVSHDGPQGLQELQNRPPDIIISDIAMPGMSGFEFCQEIKRKQRRRIPVILLTSLTDPEDVVHGLRAGADSYVTKPYKDELLLERIQALVHSKPAPESKNTEDLQVTVAGKDYTVNADRRQILGLLVSTYESAVQQNGELLRLTKELLGVQDELERKNEELAKLNQQLSAANEEKNRILGMTVHDLRNPLHVVRGVSEALSDSLKDLIPPSQLELLATMRRSSQNMLQMIDELLDITRIEAGHLELKYEEFDLVECAKRSLAVNLPFADRKGIKLGIEGANAALLLEGDQHKIQQVLDNLVNNAIKYSHQNTATILRLKALPKEVQVVVEDHGQGIPKEDIAKLFKPFSRADVSTTGGEKAVGLGLAICKRVVEGHEGRIWIESSVGQGTKVYVTLPYTRPNMRP